MARAIARERQSAAIIPISIRSKTVGALFAVPVAAAKIVSPSKHACDGRNARATPTCAIMASLLDSAFVSAASVATVAIVVFPAGALLMRVANASLGQGDGQPRPPNSLSRS